MYDNKIFHHLRVKILICINLGRLFFTFHRIFKVANSFRIYYILATQENCRSSRENLFDRKRNRHCKARPSLNNFTSTLLKTFVCILLI